MSDAPTPDPVLAGFRKSIDNIDAALIHMLAERFRITQAVGEYKAKVTLPPADPNRERNRSQGCGGSPKTVNWTPNSAKNSCASSSMK